MSVTANPTQILVLLQASKSLPPLPVLPLLRAGLQRSGWEVSQVFGPVGEAVARDKLQLTARQLQVLLLAETGLSKIEIARQLGIKPGGVDGQFRRIFKKMQVRSRCEAVAKAIRMGII